MIDDHPELSDETMPDPVETPFIIYRESPTCVVWNVQDYPIPDGLDPASIYHNIKEAIAKQGCLGEVSIQAYVDENTFSDELRRKFSDVGFKIILFPEGNEYVRYSCMIFNIMLWLFENPRPSNLIVLSKSIPEDDVHCFETLYGRHFGVLLSKTEPDWDLPNGSSALFLTSLFEGGNPSGSA